MTDLIPLLLPIAIGIFVGYGLSLLLRPFFKEYKDSWDRQEKEIAELLKEDEE